MFASIPVEDPNSFEEAKATVEREGPFREGSFMTIKIWCYSEKRWVHTDKNGDCQYCNPDGLTDE